MTVRHHPGDDLLLGYVTGALSYPIEVIIAAHLTLCSRCRESAASLESLGGEILDEIEGLPLDEEGPDSLLERLDEPEAAPPPVAPDVDDPASARLVPAPLRAMAATPLNALPWRRPLPGVSVVDLANIAEHGAKARLVRTRAGGALPRHLHKGMELTLVLAGGMTEQHGHFRRGDLLVIDPGESHRPVMDEDEDCLCFGVTDGAVLMTGLVGRLRQIVGRY